jgi:propionyl-CoA synthetase
MRYKKMYEDSIINPNGFWLEQAKQIDWFRFPEKILNLEADGLSKWYEGGTLNTCYLAVDYHVNNGRENQPAIIYDSPVTGRKQILTYQELLEKVKRTAGMLRHLGVQKGDRVIIYMPLVPETIIGMLACARIGAVHLVVFGGFAAQELAIRIDDATPKVMLTAAGGIEVNKKIPYKPIVDEALELAKHKLDHVVLLKRNGFDFKMKAERDIDWQKLYEKSSDADYIELESTDPLYIIYTSGTTGKPKGVLRDNGGHAVAMWFSMKYIYDMKPGEVYWAASDVGWVVGHSYIVYAPLMYGCTTVLYEGKPIKTPDAGSFWRVIDEHKVNVLFTAPTAFRAIRREDPEGELIHQYDISSLKTLFLAGERCDVSTLQWLEKQLGIPVIDHWWQTESGWPMVSQMTGLGLSPVKPGSVAFPVCGYDIHIFDQNGHDLGPNEEGALVIKYPLPPGTFPNLWNDTPRFLKSYSSQFPGYFFSGDGAYKDDDGYIFITGRMDDIINVAGHRLSTAEMEEIVSSNPKVAECAVIGIEDELKGQIPIGFVVLKEGVETTDDELAKELAQKVREQIGPVACYKQTYIVNRLPKTRSGKILRKTLRFIADGKPITAQSIIEDKTVIDEMIDLMKSKEIGVFANVPV